MMEQDNIYDKLKELLAQSGGSYSILEEQIDVELQVEFFEVANSLQKNKRSHDIIFSDEEKLYDDISTMETKKQLLAELSNIEKPEAFRIIERFKLAKNKELYSWSVLALQHCRINLESKLLDQQQVFISTGLGGIENKLRYFIAGKLNNGDSFSKTQHKIIKTEFEIAFKSFQSVVEKLAIKEDYFTVVVLIPIDVSLAEVIGKTIEEINNFGEFIHKEYIVTNVKVLSISEIQKYFNKQAKKRIKN